MKKYFYARNNEKVGPLSFEDLKKAGINPETLVWFDGLSNWEPAGKLEDLREIL